MKIANYIYATIMIFVVCAGLYLLLPAITDYRQTREGLAELEQTIAQQEAEILSLRREIHSLKNDPRAIERVAREKFGLCRPDEKIYHFDTPAN